MVVYFRFRGYPPWDAVWVYVWLPPLQVQLTPPWQTTQPTKNSETRGCVNLNLFKVFGKFVWHERGASRLRGRGTKHTQQDESSSRRVEFVGNNKLAEMLVKNDINMLCLKTAICMYMSVCVCVYVKYCKIKQCSISTDKITKTTTNAVLNKLWCDSTKWARVSESEMHMRMCVCVFVFWQCTHLFLHEFQFAFRLQEALLLLLLPACDFNGKNCDAVFAAECCRWMIFHR